MDAETRRSRLGLPLMAGLVGIVAAFAGSASISDRNSAPRVAPAHPIKAPGLAAAHLPAGTNATPLAPDGAPPVTLPHAGAARTKAGCTGCGVVESVRVVEQPTGARLTTGDAGYRIVIRFRDGSRQVFDEASARTLQPGERIQVIAGADLPAE
jgi:hypothetical protein